MNYFTNENDLNKYNSVTPDPKDNNNKSSVGVLDMFVTSIVRIKHLAQLSMENSSKFVMYVVFMSFLVAVTSQ